MTVGALFDEAAGGYGGARRMLVPGLDGLHAALLEAVPFGTDEPIKVLDLGAGTKRHAATTSRMAEDWAEAARRAFPCRRRRP